MPSRWTLRWLPYTFLFGFFCLWLSEFWIGDDAFITFRSVENWVAGRGPYWNLHERVQAFTHPLWFFLLGLARLFTPDSYSAALVVSGMFALSLIVTLARWSKVSLPSSLLGYGTLLFAFLGTTTWRHYLSSGLETILLMNLISWTYVLQSQRSAAKLNFSPLFWSLIGLLPITRPDGGLIVAPIALLEFVRLSHWRTRGIAALLALSPLALWSFYSWISFGELVPNTAFAKLNTGIESWRILKQGFRYLGASLLFDPLLIVFPLLGSVFLWKSYRSGKSEALAWLLGIGLHALYILKIGGDFMAGRFWIPPFILGLLVVIQYAEGISSAFTQNLWTRLLSIGGLTSLLVWALSDPHPPAWKGIANERQAYLDSAGIREYFHTSRENFPQHPWREEAQNQLQKSPGLVVTHNIGIMGYTLPPETLIIDLNALSDPLLARLPSEPGWRIGHFTRALPPGYLESLKTGSNQIPTPLKAHGILASLASRKIVRLDLARELIQRSTSKVDSNSEL